MRRLPFVGNLARYTPLVGSVYGNCSLQYRSVAGGNASLLRRCPVGAWVRGVADSAADTAETDGVAVAERDTSGAAAANGAPAAAPALNIHTNGAAASHAEPDAAPPAFGLVTAVPAPAAAGEPASADQAATPRSSLAGQLLRRFVPARLRRWTRALATWSHSRRALRLGTAGAAVLGLVTATALALVGFGGVGTHVFIPPAQPPDAYSSGLSNDASGYFPQIFYPPPMLFGPPLGASAPSSSTLAGLVLQTYDVPIDFRATEQGAIPAAPADGLAGSYHVVYQRTLGSVDSGELGAAISVLSLVGSYRDVPAAAAQLENDDLSTLGTLAGLPDFVAEPVSITEDIGDETRVVHLTGDADGVPTGVYLVEFRYGAIDGIVAVAAPEGSESLSDALQLARQQESRLEQAAPLNP